MSMKMVQQAAGSTVLQGACSNSEGCALHARGGQHVGGVRVRSVLGAAVLIVGYVMLLPGVEARLTNPCTTHWTVPSKDNRVSCPSSGSTWLKWSEAEGIVYTLLPAILGIILLILGLPMTLVSRYCFNCCGSAKMRPGYVCCGGEEFDEQADDDKIAQYDPKAIIAIKVSTVLVTLVCIGAIVFMYFGAQDSTEGLKDVIPRTRGVFNELQEVVDEVKAIAIRAAAQSASYTFSVSEVDELISRVTGALDDTEKQAKPLTDAVSDPAIFAALVSILPCVIIATLAVAALFNVRSFLPLAVVVCCFILQMLWFMIGSAAFVVSAGFNTVCDEAAAVNNNERGILSWYGIPLCEDEIKSVQMTVSNIPRTLSGTFCTNLGSSCSPPVVCPNPFPTCTTFAEAQALFSTITIENDPLCGSSCTITQCAAQCSAQPKAVAQDVVDGLALISDIIDVQQKFLPWLDCRQVALRLFDTALPPVCTTASDGMNKLAAGALLVACTLVCTIMIALLGQKRFVKQRKARSISTLMGVDSFLCRAENTAPSPPIELVNIPWADSSTSKPSAQQHAPVGAEPDLNAQAAGECTQPKHGPGGNSRSSSELSLI